MFSRDNLDLCFSTVQNTGDQRWIMEIRASFWLDGNADRSKQVVVSDIAWIILDLPTVTMSAFHPYKTAQRQTFGIVGRCRYMFIVNLAWLNPRFVPYVSFCFVERHPPSQSHRRSPVTPRCPSPKVDSRNGRGSRRVLGLELHLSQI